MNASHIAGGGLGAVVGALIVGCLRHFGVATISDVDATVIGSAALGAGVGIGHAVAELGLIGIGQVILHGRRKPALPPAPPPS